MAQDARRKSRGAAPSRDDRKVAAAPAASAARSDRPPLTLPAVPITDVVVLPQMIVPLHLDTWAHVRAVEVAMLGDRQIFLLPRSGQGDEADAHTPGRIGLIATVEESRPSRRGGQRVIVRGAQRGILVEAVQSEPYLQV